MQKSKFNISSPQKRTGFESNHFYKWSNDHMYWTSYRDMSNNVKFNQLSSRNNKLKTKIMPYQNIKDLYLEKIQTVNFKLDSHLSLGGALLDKN